MLEAKQLNLLVRDGGVGYAWPIVATISVMCNLMLLRLIFKVIVSQKKPSSTIRSRDLQFQFEIEGETDGRWMAEIPEVPGALAYGSSAEEALEKPLPHAGCDCG